ncbi:MAG TPA: hypothetical protein VEJ44_03905 [Acidimicrobiales bacterium]|nr:hypothetical protein [Acidimicrobiales bacterium]
MSEGAPADFEPVVAAARLLSDLSVPWWITGGWSIDLAVGHLTRSHDDVDVLLLEADAPALQELRGVDLQLFSGPSDERRVWTSGRKLRAGADRVQLESPLLLQPTSVLFGAASDSNWVYHRGKPTITRPLADLTVTCDQIPCLAPEVTLAMKAMSGRPKDDHDFWVVLPRLDGAQREWLADAVARRWASARRRAGDPASDAERHPWVRALRDAR